ncbi:hypothetical protein FJ420_06085 [Mesorhizobium sp. B3-1-3]|nr:hypothetical protein FJ424_02625 [Mesorhizobium sp. B3-1-8]TPI74489.1 hypothetical protein FJ420_06085 [Mesorhizobium sp. B3-1-3]
MPVNPTPWASPARRFLARASCLAATVGWPAPRASASPARRSAAMPACSSPGKRDRGQSMFRYLLAPAILGAATLLAAPSQAAVAYVKICSAYGANYYYSPGTDTCINAQTGVTKKQVDDGNGGEMTEVGKTALAAHVDDIDNRITRAFENASISAALAAPDLVQGEHFGVRVNWGNAGYANAFGITGAAVLSEGFDHGGRLTSTLGIAFAGSQVGGNVGLQFSW